MDPLFPFVLFHRPEACSVANLENVGRTQLEHVEIQTPLPSCRRSHGFGPSSGMGTLGQAWGDGKAEWNLARKNIIFQSNIWLTCEVLEVRSGFSFTTQYSQACFIVRLSFDMISFPFFLQLMTTFLVRLLLSFGKSLSFGIHKPDLLCTNVYTKIWTLIVPISHSPKSWVAIGANSLLPLSCMASLQSLRKAGHWPFTSRLSQSQ